MIIGRATWTADRPPMRAYVFSRGSDAFHGDAQEALSRLIGTVDRNRDTLFFDQSQYVVAGIWGEPAPEYESKLRQERIDEFANNLLLLSGGQPLKEKGPLRTFYNPVVVCISYWPREEVKYTCKQYFLAGKYDEWRTRQFPNVRDGLPLEFLEVLDLEEKHRKDKTLDAFVRTLPKLDDASLQVDKMYQMPPA